MSVKQNDYLLRLEESVDVLRMAMVLKDMSVIKPEHLNIALSILDKELFILQEGLDE